MTETRDRRGLTAVGVLVSTAIVGLVGLYLLMALPRNRDESRRLTCQRNLMQIGTALGLYHHSTGHLPTVVLGGDSPVAAMLNELGQPDFLGLRDRTKPPPRAPGFTLVERPVRGLICPTDPEARAGRFKAPISYRANAGESDGRHGPFSPGQIMTIESVEAARGASFTAAFAERLVGDSVGGVHKPSAYDSVNTLIGNSCPIFGPSHLRGDAGESWRYADWRSTLYSHAPPPNSYRSCIAKDGLSGLMGASSQHQAGVNVLMLDGSLRTVRPSIGYEVWTAMGRVEEAPR